MELLKTRGSLHKRADPDRQYSGQASQWPLFPMGRGGIPAAAQAEGRLSQPISRQVVAADLKAIGAPAAVVRIDGDASVMSPLDAAGMAIKQAVDLHHPVNGA